MIQIAVLAKHQVLKQGITVKRCSGTVSVRIVLKTSDIVKVMNLSQPEQKTSSESRYLALMMPCTMVVRTCLIQSSIKRAVKGRFVIFSMVL